MYPINTVFFQTNMIDCFHPSICHLFFVYSSYEKGDINNETRTKGNNIT